MPRIALLMVTLLAALHASADGWAHPGGEPLIHVPLDHVMPGEFPLIGEDLGENAVVTFELKQDDVVLPLGDVTAASDGHFKTTLALPATFPDGYAQLSASSSDGSSASTWILVGERTEATPAQPDQTGSGPGRTAIVLALVLGVAGAALAFAAMRFSGRTRGGRSE